MRAFACFSAKEKDLGILFGLFFVYFCLFPNYSDSREHYKNPETFLFDNDMFNANILTIFVDYMRYVFIV